ncbi:histone deacetylase [Allokutzneria sp. NRRL B-24872]|uniref:histone deacetylase n=1 Tax=Allokutzneria sp. NRRL B-24872 TaxID=1137961 RepID=UPI00143D942F|nr:histone deacetylase [Allokutzneria sp. NRRL B-24872]
MDVFWHEDCFSHDAGHGLWELPGDWPWLDVAEQHPENADRLRTMLGVLRRGPIAPRLRWHEGRAATEEELATVHDRGYLDALKVACAGPERVALEENTVVGPGSWPAILAAAGTTLAAMEAVLDGRARTAYAMVRPPGHHAQPAAADGYCMVNNIALAAALAKRGGARRVAILDWDVHHGNGTQEAFLSDPDVLTISVHMRHGSWGGSHPQTGAPDELGALGRNANIELSLGAGDSAYLRALEEVAAPLLRAFRPDVLLCASGFDASAFDPNGRHNVTAEGYRAIGRRVAGLADELTGGRLLLTQEGGYQRGYAAVCLHALVEGLLGITQPLLPDPIAYVPDDAVRNAAVTDADLAAVLAALTPHWPGVFP